MLGRNPSMKTTNLPPNLPDTPPPKVGDDVYVNGSMYMSHGMDDFEGGLCEITKVSVGISAGKPEWYIEIKERPGYSYNYSILMESQDEWKAQYGTNRGHPDPDYREEFNRWD